jgi:hypothetical protein
MFSESVELEDFYHHSLCMVGFATPMNSNIISESNAINSIYFYIKSWIIYFLTNVLD